LKELLSFIKKDDSKNIDDIKKIVKQNYLRFWQVHSPHFTDHGENHYENVLSILDRMIPDLVKKSMDAYEIFLMICGVWLHDIGLIAGDEGESDEQIRANHHIKSRELIRTGLDELTLSEEERFVVGEMAFYHRKCENISNVKEIYEVSHNKCISRIRLRFLCSLIRLADGCEIAHIRSSRKFVKIAGLNEEANFHHEVHLHVSAVRFDSKNNKIKISIRVKNKNDSDLLLNFLGSNLEQELLSVKDVLRKYGVIFEEICFDITYDDFARKLPSPKIKRSNLTLEEKLAEFEKQSGYYPNMVIDEKEHIHLFYDTLSQTVKELQKEVLTIIPTVGELFPKKEIIFLTINTVHDYRGTRGTIDPEILSVISKKMNLKKYRKKEISKEIFWKNLTFLKKRKINQFIKFREKYLWRLIE